MSEQNKISTQELYQQQGEALYDLIMSSSQEWRKQWASEEFTQRNAFSDNPYSNLNQTLLFKRAVSENFDDPRWLTFKQAQEAGLKVKKGSKGSKIYRVVRTYDRILKDENGNKILDENGKAQTETVQYLTPIMKAHTVFNAKDIDGIEPFKHAEIPEQHKLLLQQEKYQNAETMIKAFCEKNGIAIKEIASEKAFYQGNNGNSEKQVVIPLKSQFDDLNDYFSVLFHEVGHSTKTLGIRINTETDTPRGNKFGSKNYAKEELTAELTALFLCKQFSIDSSATANQEENSFAYLKSWINAGVLNKDDFNVAVIEANRATKAIYEHAPQMTLSLNDFKQSETQKEQQEIKPFLDEVGLERDIERVEATMLRWDKAQLNKLETTDGEEITKIKLLWSEASVSDENKDFGTDLKALQNWFSETFKNTNDPHNPLSENTVNHYDKSLFEITYKGADDKQQKFELRIDVGKGNGDFNPFENNVKSYLEKSLNRQFIEQTPKLSNEIKQELKQKQAENIEVKRPKGITMH